MSCDTPVRDSDYRLLWPRTLVVRITLAGHRFYGVVGDYEHHSPTQKMFPVRFGDRTRQMTSLDVQERTDVPQPRDRRPPRRTGAWAVSSPPWRMSVPAQRTASPPSTVATVAANTA